MWVPLIENNEHESDGADYFVKEYLDKILSQSPNIDTVVLACTHYPLLLRKIKQYIPGGVTVLAQGKIVARSLKDYLHRHTEMEQRLTKTGKRSFYTTDDAGIFDKMAEIFFGQSVSSEKIDAEAL
jgi:glutamate racemase